MKPIVTIDGIHFAYGKDEVVSGLSMTFNEGECVALMGPSGCGKSTLLRLLSGLEVPLDGTILFFPHGRPVRRGDASYLFQDYNSYPWLTVFENIQQASGPKPFPSTERVHEIVNSVGLNDNTNRYPVELSLGMRKRLGLARVMVRSPQLILFDEPFSSLDVLNKRQMWRLVTKRESPESATIVIVTHDPVEASEIADRIIVFNASQMKIEKEFRIGEGARRNIVREELIEFLEGSRDNVCIR